MLKAEQSGTDPAQLAAIAASSGCWSRSFWIQQYNNLGFVLYRYNETHDWCGDGTWINYIHVYTWPSNLMAGVGYSGDKKSSVYGISWNVWKEHLSGHFTFVATPWGYLYNYTPWIEYQVGGGGQQYYENYGF